MFRHFIVAACLVCLALSSTSQAADTDIYIAANTSAATNPNILVVIDNSSNWSASFGNSAPACSSNTTKFCNELLALTTVLNGLNSNVNVGLAMFAETGTNGAYIRFAARPMDNTNKTRLIAIINGLIRQGSGSDSSGSNQPYGYTMFEAFKYFGGYSNPANANADTAGSPTGASSFGPIAYAGGASNNSGTYRRDYAGNSRSDSAGALSGNALASASSNTYQSPIANACQKNFVIFISNGNPSTGGDSSIGAINTTLGMNTTAISPPNHASTFDEWARFLNQTDVSSLTGKQSVITYTVGVYDPQNNCTISSSNNCASTSDNNMLQLMASAARVGGGKSYTTANYTDLSNALRLIFTEIQSVNSVFASASLPVSVNTQGTYLNQIFIGMFRPDADALPQWGGNLKQYKFSVDSSRNVSMTDIQGSLVINPATGFISNCSESFWSSSSAGASPGTGYWSFNPQGSCGGADTSSDLPDGEVVEKGAAAQKLRASTVNATTGAITRTLYTTDGASLTTFDTGNASITQGLLGASSSTERTNVINWLRGLDNADENGNTVTNEMRPYVHGDVVHSRPMAVDFGGTTGVVVFYGDNTGAYHAITGGQAASDGRELWAFIPPECYAIPKRVRDKSPLVDFWGGSNPFGHTPAPTAKNYCMDGGSGILKDNTRTWIYPVMRRGGRSIYAFNVTAPGTPAFGWRLTNASAGMSNLGQTWSTPRAAQVNGYNGPVVIVGGGYDTCEDQNAAPNTSCPSKPQGSDVYVLDALSGNLIKTLTVSGMKSIAADVTLVDDNDDRTVDLAYAVDTGGNIYRIDFAAGGPNNWSIKKIADLGDGQRKFLYAAEVIKATGHHGILVGSGDREHPLASHAANGVTNRFYYVKDAGNITTPTLDSQLTDLGQEGSSTASCGSTPSINQYGWRLLMRQGEQVVTSAVVVGGVAYFSTNQPVPLAANSCGSNLGKARGYALTFLEGKGSLNNCSRSGEFAGGGLPPSPVYATVQIDGKPMVICVGCISDINASPIGAIRPPINVSKTRTRTWRYWLFD